MLKTMAINTSRKSKNRKHQSRIAEAMRCTSYYTATTHVHQFFEGVHSGSADGVGRWVRVFTTVQFVCTKDGALKTVDNSP